MSNKSELIINNKLNVLNIISWLFGMAVLAIGIINTVWGNDAGFGIFLILLSFVYFPPVNAMIRKMIGVSIPGVAKIILGILIIWVTLGVGELFNKIELMVRDL